MRRHSNVVACALANKLARTAWALATHNTAFKLEPNLLTSVSLKSTHLVLRLLKI